MFGMLDYRARKLFVLLSLPLWLVAMVVPYGLIAAVSALSIEQFERLPVALVVAILGMETAILLFQLVFSAANWVFRKTFDFIVDVVPAEGRNKQEAQAVLLGGETERQLLNLTKDPEGFDFEQQMVLVRSLKRSQGLLARVLRGLMGAGPDSWFQSRIEDRVQAVLNAAQAQAQNSTPIQVGGPGWIDQVLDTAGLSASRTERFLVEQRHVLYKYAFFVVVFILIVRAR